MIKIMHTLAQWLSLRKHLVVLWGSGLHSREKIETQRQHTPQLPAKQISPLNHISPPAAAPCTLQISVPPLSTPKSTRDMGSNIALSLKLSSWHTSGQVTVNHGWMETLTDPTNGTPKCSCKYALKYSTVWPWSIWARFHQCTTGQNQQKPLPTVIVWDDKSGMVTFMVIVVISSRPCSRIDGWSAGIPSCISFWPL